MNEQSSIDAVVFDVGRVLFLWDLRLLCARLIDDPDEVEWVVANVVSEHWHYQQDQGRDLEEMVAERKLEFPRYAHVIDAYATRFEESIPGPVPGSLELVERLDTAGVPLFAITNFGDAFWAPFRQGQPVFDRFRDIVVSGTEKVAKPDPEIFRLAERRFGIDPSRTLFIDDRPANVAVARDLGWQAHHFHDAAALERDLVARGLLAG